MKLFLKLNQPGGTVSDTVNMRHRGAQTGFVGAVFLSLLCCSVAVCLRMKNHLIPAYKNLFVRSDDVAGFSYTRCAGVFLQGPPEAAV